MPLITEPNFKDLEKPVFREFSPGDDFYEALIQTHEGLTDAQITKAVESVFSFKPADIVKQLNLLRPIYGKTTNYGHFGKIDADLPWEKTDKVQALQKAIK